jgi:MerR family redox-sensitive transcriptional activator SoxR
MLKPQVNFRSSFLCNFLSVIFSKRLSADCFQRVDRFVMEEIMKPPIKTLSIGQVAERTGLSVSALRFYEEAGLVAPSRNAGGQRRYPRADLRRLSFIMIAQQLGFSLVEIREKLTSLPQGRPPNQGDWARISQQFRAQLEQRIKLLSLTVERLDGCIGCGCLSLKNCALYNPNDRIAARGAGPRYLLGDLPDEA